MKFKYGHSFMNVNTNMLPECEVLDNTLKSEKSYAEIVGEALANPIDSPRLREIVSPGEKICLVVSDVTRAYQHQDIFLPFIIDELNNAGIPDEDITLLCSTGAHGRQSEEEKKLVLGENLYGRFILNEHDCSDEEQLCILGKTSFGTEIKVNKKLIACDRIILTGAIVPHDMAGYGGGRKSVAPGLAGYSTIAANHGNVFNKDGYGLNPGCILGNIKGNTMHEDMNEICAMVNPDFMFNVVLDTAGNFYKAVAGHWNSAFVKGTEYCDEANVVYISEPADFVIAGAGGYPKDLDMYQASKCYSAAVMAAKEGAYVLVIAQCPDSMGAKESADIIMDYDTNSERNKAMKKEFVPEAYSGYLLCELAAKYNLMLVSDYENEEEMKKCGIQLFRSTEEAFASVDYNKVKKTYVLPNGSAVIPKMKKQL